MEENLSQPQNNHVFASTSVLLKHLNNPYVITNEMRIAARNRLKLKGVKITDFAKENGFEPQRVYRVLNGLDQGNYGTAHRIAVALGLKPSSDEVE
jgi:gp16 family phage-associated protein